MDRFTEGMLKKLEGDVKKRFGVSLSDVIEDPSAYLGEKGFAVKLSKITDYIDSETSRMIEQSRASGKSFHEGAAKADELTRKVGAYISSHARQSNVPFVRPADVELSLFGQSKFYLSQMDDSTSKFLEKLVESSSFVADMTKDYDSLRLGAWLFGGDKETIVAVHSPANGLLLLRAGRAEIMQRLKEASDSIKGL